MLLQTTSNKKIYPFKVTPFTDPSQALYFLIEVTGGESFLAEREGGYWAKTTAKHTAESLLNAILHKIERASIYMSLERILRLQ